MRDLMADLEEGQGDPVARARAAQRVPLPKRFYKEVSVGEAEDGFTVLLDGRPVRTPGRSLLQVPVRAVAQAMAGEWTAQGEHIDPFSMPLTRLVNVALDRVAPEMVPVGAEMVRYAGTDMLFYRAEGPQGLVERQARAWDPVLDWMREAHGARFFLSQGIRHVTQPEDALARVEALVPNTPLTLAAAHSMTTLTGSALLALAVDGGRLDVDAAWDAAHVDEDWNRDQWGEDELAARRRAARRSEMDAAAQLMALLRAEG